MSPTEFEIKVEEGYIAHVGIDQGERRKFGPYLHEGNTFALENGRKVTVLIGEVLSLFIRPALSRIVRSGYDNSMKSVNYKVGGDGEGWFQQELPRGERVNLQDGKEVESFGVVFRGKRVRR